MTNFLEGLTLVPCHTCRTPGDRWLQEIAQEQAHITSAEDQAVSLAASELRLQQQLAEAQAEQRAERDHAEERLTAMQGEKSASREGLQCRLQTGSNVPTHVACVQASMPLTWQLQMQDKAASMTIMCSSWPVRKADTGI